MFPPLLLGLLPLFIFYARSVESEVASAQAPAMQNAPIAARIARVNRVVQGHTHLEKHRRLEDGVEYLNTGTWSPAYHDVECTQPYGRKCFAWIRPGAADGTERAATLYEWKGDHAEVVPGPEADPSTDPATDPATGQSSESSLPAAREGA